jgi:HIRAN domain
MGPLRRLFGQPASSAPMTRELAAEEVQEQEEAGEPQLVEIEIRGESFRQAELEALAGPKGPDGKHVLEGVTLRCEPDNAYDPNAVRVEVMGQLVGYVAREQAGVVSRGMQQACGGVLEERGLIVGGWRDERGEGSYGIRVWLTRHDADRIGVRPSAPTVEEHLIPWPEIPRCGADERRLSPSMADLEAERWGSTVTVVGEEHYQEAVTSAVPEGWNRRYCPALVELDVAARNPHSKHETPCVEVRIAGRTVGYFTPNMTDRYRALIDATRRGGDRATAEAQIHRGTKGGTEFWRVQVEMRRGS